MMSKAKSINGLYHGLAGMMALFVGFGSMTAADSSVLSAADWVVFQVVGPELPVHPAEAATHCILNAASPEELRLLARDYGVSPKAETTAMIREIAQRPAAGSCFASAGVPPLFAR